MRIHAIHAGNWRPGSGKFAIALLVASVIGLLPARPASA